MRAASGFFLSAALGLLLSGCFRQVHETTAEDSGAYLALDGEGGSVTLFVDGEAVAKGVVLLESKDVRYRVEKGTHDIRVERDGKAVVQRRIYVGDGETRVIDVPGR
jgi:hypothetical protein